MIQQSHSTLIDICHSIAWVPRMTISATVREYFLNVVCNSSGGGGGGGEGGRSLMELKGHFQAYLHVYERAVFGNGVLTHDDWQYFTSNYDYIYQTLMAVKQKESQDVLLAKLAKHKRKSLFTSSTFNNAGMGRSERASSGYKTGRTKGNKGRRRSSLSMSVVGETAKAGVRHSKRSTFHKRSRSKDDGDVL